jgi:ATP-dependent DNA helicase RecG
VNISVVTLSEDEASALLTLEESHFLDLKSIDVAPATLAKTVSAFANTSGGEAYVGIDERIGSTGKERVWRGFADQEAANAMIQVLEKMSPLGNHYDATFLSSANASGLVLLITVFKTRELLLAPNGKPYVRRGAQKLPVEGAAAIQRLKYEKGISSFEDEQLSDVDPVVITNSETIIKFLLDVVPTAEPEAWLEKQRLMLKGRPTLAGVMLFNDEPQAILPKRSAIKLFRYATKAEGERDFLAFDPISVEGPAYELVYAAVDRVKALIEQIEKLGPSGLTSVQYPQEAIHEIITNAVLHRDYSLPADIQVRIYDNRVEIESPGRLPGHVTPANILSEQFARNPKMVRIINKFPDPPNKDVGEGLNTAFEAMDKLRLKPPLIDERENSVVVILRHEALGSPEQLVMDYLQEHEQITNAIGRELTGIKSENTMKEVFYRLRKRQLLEQVPEMFGNKAAWRKPVSMGPSAKEESVD